MVSAGTKINSVFLTKSNSFELQFVFMLCMPVTKVSVHPRELIIAAK